MSHEALRAAVELPISDSVTRADHVVPGDPTPSTTASAPPGASSTSRSTTASLPRRRSLRTSRSGSEGGWPGQARPAGSPSIP